MRDEDIDYSDIPEVDEDFFKTAKIMVPPGKKQLTLCLGGCFGLDETTGLQFAGPYPQKFLGETLVRIVVKIGGSILQEDLTEFAQDLKQVNTQHEIILVHGGARIVTEISEKMGNTPKFIESPEGYRSRYTDKNTIETFTIGLLERLGHQYIYRQEENREL